MTRFRILVAAAAVGLIAAATPAPAAIVVINSRSDFLAASQPGFFSEQFNSTPVGPFFGPISFSGNGFGFTANAPLTNDTGSQGNLASTQIPSGDVGLSVNFPPSATLDFSNFTGGPRAVGGNFYLTNFSGDQVFTGNTLQVTVSDGSTTLSVPIANPTASTFLGFVSTTGTITSLSLRNLNTDPSLNFLYYTTFDQFGYVTAGELILANPVPVPPTAALALLGAASFGGGRLLRRRLGVTG